MNMSNRGYYSTRHENTRDTSRKSGSHCVPGSRSLRLPCMQGTSFLEKELLHIALPDQATAAQLQASVDAKPKKAAQNKKDRKQARSKAGHVLPPRF